MGIAVTCQGCQARLNVRDDMAGAKGKCPKCGATLRIPGAPSGSKSRASSQGSPSSNGRPSDSSAALLTPLQVRPTAARTSSAVKPTLNAVFQGQVPPVGMSVGYRTGVFLVACYVVALLVLYYCVVVAAFVAVGWYAVAGLSVFGEQGNLTDIAIYLATVCVGLLGALLLAKTVVAPASHPAQVGTPVSEADEPLLFDFIRRIATEVRAAMPQQVELDCDIFIAVQPPKGWRAPFGKRLRLTIGLPLVEGLSLQELGGLIAHELALFTGTSGKRRAYIIRSVSEWFQRIVAERDAWDIALLRSAGRLGPVGVWAIVPLRAGIWLVRWVPWLFMALVHLPSGVLMRQMEFNADKYQTRLVGSEAFETACKRRILLQYALRGTQSDLEMLNRAASLPDNLPRFVVATAAQQPDEVRQTMLDLIDRFHTGPLDPRPGDKERIAAAHAERSVGVLHGDVPAAQLFADFDETARKVTLAYYKSLFSSGFVRSSIRPVEELIDCQVLQEQASEARKRFFLGAFGLLRPLKLPSPQIHPPANLQLVQAQLQHQRDQMLNQASAYAADYALYAEADNQFVEASRAVALFKAGLTPRADQFSTSFVSQNQARDVRTSSEATMAALAAKMEAFEWSAGQRLHAALTLMHAPQCTEQLKNANVRPGECDRLLLVVSSLAANLEDVYRLRTDHARLTALVEHARGSSPGAAVMQELQRRTARVFRELKALYSMVEHLEYPFPDESRANVAKYLLPTLPPSNNLQAVIERSQEFLDNVVSLYGRSIDRLCSMAEGMEGAVMNAGTTTSRADVEK